MKKKAYIIPQLKHEYSVTEEMLLLQISTEQLADPEGEVLTKEGDWNIWDD